MDVAQFLVHSGLAGNAIASFDPDIKDCLKCFVALHTPIQAMQFVPLHSSAFWPGKVVASVLLGLATALEHL